MGAVYDSAIAVNRNDDKTNELNTKQALRQAFCRGTHHLGIDLDSFRFIIWATLDCWIDITWLAMF